MALDGDEALEDAKLLIAERVTAVAAVTSSVTNAQAFKVLMSESGMTAEHEASEEAGTPIFRSIRDNNADVVGQVDGWLGGVWLGQLARYLSDNAGIDITNPTTGSVIRALIAAMLDDGTPESVQRANPSIGSPTYDESNQGSGSASIAVHSNTTLLELLPDGKVVLECLSGSYTEQNAERWALSFIPSFQFGGGEQQRRRSRASGFVSGDEYIDVVSTVPAIRDDERLQVPQTGGAIHTGLVITIDGTSIDYDDVSESGDTDGVFSAYRVTLKVGTKSPLTKRNSTWAYDSSNGRHLTIYLHVTKDGSNYYAIWRKGSSATSTALTEQLTFTTSTTGTQTWKVADTNPEAAAAGNGGELIGGTNGDDFISATVTGSGLTQSAVVAVSFPGPWARGDRIYAAATNSYGGKIQRAFVEGLGIALPASASPTISDPS